MRAQIGLDHLDPRTVSLQHAAHRKDFGLVGGEHEVAPVLGGTARQFQSDAGGGARDDGEFPVSRHQFTAVPGFSTTLVQSFWL